MPATRICSIEGCDKHAVTRGWCPAHYQRWRQKGDAGATPGRRGRHKAPAAKCSAPNCTKTAVTRGWCPAHYQRWRQKGSIDDSTLLRRGRKIGYSSGVVREACSVGICERSARTAGFCGKHYKHCSRHGHPVEHPLSAYELKRVEKRAWLDVAKQYVGEECLIWPFDRHKNGRALWANSGLQSDLVNRIMCFELYGSPPTPAHHAAHSCGNGHLACVAPKHLYWATPKQNVQDMLRHGTYFRGARNRLCDGDVRRIKSQIGKRKTSAIAADFGVSSKTICHIARGATYRHVT